MRDRATAGPLGSSMAKVYSCGLLLLMVLFVWFFYQGRTLHGLETLFPPQQPLTPQEVEARHQRLEEEFAGALFDPKDGADLTETTGYYRLLQSLYQSAATSRKPPRFNRELAMREPDAQRGQQVLVRGWSGSEGMYPHRLDKPVLIPGGTLTDVWRVLLTDAERDNAVIVDVLEDPGKVNVDDEFECEALFWRIVKFTPGNGGPDARRETPYLLARTIRPVPEQGPRPGMSRFAVYLVLAVMLGVLLFGIHRILRAQRRPNLRAEIRRASLKLPPDAPSNGGGTNP
jgi:hypothetical protein